MGNPLPDLNEMLIFTHVVEAGSFTAAADKLGLPKSTVSRRISQLEARLGVRLLQRTTRSLTLTELGAGYYERSARILADAEEADRNVSHGQALPRGRLRVSAPVEMGGRLGALVTGYLQQYPDVRVELDLSNRFVDLVEEGFDLAIRAGQLEDSSLIARRLGTSRLGVYASPAYLRTHGTPTTPEALREHESVQYGSTGPGNRLDFSGPTGLVSISLRGRLTVNSLTAALQAGVHGLGVIVMPASICRAEVERGELQALLGDWSLPTGGVYAVYPSPRHLTPKVRSFIDYLAENLPVDE